jgi:hypothetical protein
MAVECFSITLRSNASKSRSFGSFSHRFRSDQISKTTAGAYNEKFLGLQGGILRMDHNAHGALGGLPLDFELQPLDLIGRLCIAEFGFVFQFGENACLV